MGIADNLNQIIARQKELTSELETEQQALENSDLAKENAALKADSLQLRADIEQLGGKAAKLAEENSGLKNAIYEQIYNEKIKIINSTKQKLDIYFRAEVDGEFNKLTFLEDVVTLRIKNFKETLSKNYIDAEDEIYTKLDELSSLLDSKLTEARARAGQVPGAFTRQELDELESLKNEQITDEQIREVTKKNNIERFVGLNVLNAIGIFLIIIGAITLARFTYQYLSDLLKGIMLFALGAIMLGAGEILNRKKPNIFSLGISAGGIGVLYAALATSYFGLNILGMYPAIILCVLITAGAFTLSNRYNSQTIAVFALIGGYLPMFSFESGVAVVYGAMVYFIALNLFALLVSFSKKWRVSSFTGLALNIAGTIYICTYFSSSDTAYEKLILILYILFAFLIYTAIPIVSTYRTKAKFRNSDIILLAINTLCSSLTMYAVFYAFDLEGYNGLLAVIFAAVYLFLGRFIEKKFEADEHRARALFYITGLAFVVLIVPLQFERIWFSLGWLAEGVILATYGVVANDKRIKQPGFIICLLCLGSFIVFDCVQIDHYLFVYKYLAITLGSLAILGAYMYKKMMSGLFVRVYKYFAMSNVWIFSMYMITGKLGAIFRAAYGRPVAFQVDYLLYAAGVIATFGLAYTYLRLKLLADRGTKILAIVLYIIGNIWLLFANIIGSPVGREYFRTGTPAFGITLAGTLILVLMTALSLFAMRDLVRTLVLGRRLGIEWYPLIISGYFVIILTQNLITQYALSFSSVAISIIYVLAALAWIIFGFARRYSFIRKFGLGMAILAVIKLFLVDLASLTQGYRIVSYFALGISLVAISFVYQYFNKRLEIKEGTSDGPNKGN
ncbi:MAG: DUF2339 domain-containing protein [Oscillospiraceae bacterium]|nr:DUF2339 domain-containing protein [Oscillospiraceae bacterium]